MVCGRPPRSLRSRGGRSHTHLDFLLSDMPVASTAPLQGRPIYPRLTSAATHSSIHTRRTTERGCTKYVDCSTCGAASQEEISWGDARAVSIHRRQCCPLSAAMGGSSKVNGSQ